MKRCKECSNTNPDRAKFCMSCGTQLRSVDSTLKTAGLLGSVMSGFGLAPLVSMAVDNGSGSTVSNLGTVTSVSIRPLKDGTWYCPDCGCHNDRFAQIYAGCSREAV